MKTNNSPNIKILVACHKADPNIHQDDIYMPIQVGKALHNDLNLGFTCDNSGDNISEKNDSYCELTALYWAWKNLKNVDYIGLAHYRRYFDFSKSSLKPIFSAKSHNPSEDKQKIEKLLSPNTIIVAAHNHYPYSVAIDYARGHHSDDLRTLYSIIKEKFNEFTISFEEAIFNRNSSAPYNMFLASRDMFDEYCSFLFPVLEEMEKRSSTVTYNDYQKRLFGFLAERLLNVFILYKKTQGIKVIKLPVIWISEDSSTLSLPHHLMNVIRYKLAFILAKHSKPYF